MSCYTCQKWDTSVKKSFYGVFTQNTSEECPIVQFSYKLKTMWLMTNAIY